MIDFDFKAAIQVSEKDALAEVLRKAADHYDELKPELKAILDDAVQHPAEVFDSAEHSRAVDLALMLFSYKRETSVFSDVYRLIRSDEFNGVVSDTCWIGRELHRVISSTCTPDDLDVIADALLDENRNQAIRQQALLALPFIWLENIATEAQLTEVYRRILERGLSGGDNWQLWIALVVNAAVIGGAKLKPTIMGIIDSGKLGTQGAFVRKIVNGLFSKGNGSFREMLRREHRGLFLDMGKEADLYLNPPPEADDQPEGKAKTFVREDPKVGRNDPCPCGSGLKYKKCCGKQQ